MSEIEDDELSISPIQRGVMRQVALRKLGQHCAFPGCTYQTTLAEGVIATEIAHIHAAAPGGPRFDASVARPDDLDNLIILCPNHHRLVDAEPHRFSADVLRRFKDSHAKQLAIESTNLEPLHPVGKSASGPRLSYASALRFWRERTSEPNEEVWHQLFRNNPQIIALAVPGDIVQIGDKCYVGGKSWTNTGGSIVDFLYASRPTANVTLVEIKTPATRLIGDEYRKAVFAPSSALAGSVVQAWSYRDNLLKNYYALANRRGEVPVDAFCPQCLLIIGNSQLEFLHAAERRSSFELFRNSLTQTVIVTYDELFNKVASIIDLVNDDYDLQS